MGVRTTLIGAGVLGAIATFAPLLIRGVRQMDGGPVRSDRSPLPATL